MHDWLDQVGQKWPVVKSACFCATFIILVKNNHLYYILKYCVFNFLNIFFKHFENGKRKKKHNSNRTKSIPNLCVTVQMIPLSGLAVSSDYMELFLALIPPHRYISHTTADFTIFITWIWNLVAFVWPCLLFPCGQVVAFVTRHFPIASAFRVYSWRPPSSQLLIWDVGAMQKL